MNVGVRLAIRHEGAFVNAYLARLDTMDGAKLVGSLLSGVADNPAIWEKWKALMSDIMADAVEAVFGERPHMMDEQAPPEHEKSGQA